MWLFFDAQKVNLVGVAYYPCGYGRFVRTIIVPVSEVKPIRAPGRRIFVQAEPLENSLAFASLPFGTSHCPFPPCMQVTDDDRAPKLAWVLSIRSCAGESNQIAAIRAGCGNRIAVGCSGFMPCGQTACAQEEEK
jgi:hypothetical protein